MYESEFSRNTHTRTLGSLHHMKEFAFGIVFCKKKKRTIIIVIGVCAYVCVCVCVCVHLCGCTHVCAGAYAFMHSVETRG